MDEQLLHLRRESYRAAADYHRALEHWQTISRSQENGAALSATLQHHREIAAAYPSALEALSSYLLTLEPTKLVTAEIRRVLKLKDSLAREIKLIF
jgi:hypothetical protein